jgi:hypothetical protein
MTARLPTAGVLALAVAWAMATLQIAIPGLGINAGFLAASLALFSSVALLAWASHRAWAEQIRDNAPALLACGFIVAGEGLTAILAANPWASFFAFSRTAIVALFGAACWAGAPHPRARNLFAGAGGLTILVNALVLIAALVGPEQMKAWAFVQGQHQYLGGLPRFVGLASHPVTQGMQLVLASALVASAPCPFSRRVLRGGWTAIPWLGLVLAAATLSVATLCLPLVLAVLLLRPTTRPGARWMRGAAWAVLAAVPALVLHFHALSVSWGQHTLALGQLHPSYSEAGLGDRFMPLHHFAAGPWVLAGHWTAYASVLVDAFACFVHHPLTGVGPGQFAAECPLRMTMGSYGEWGAGGSGYGQLNVLLAERGLVGLTFLSIAAWMVLRARRGAGKPLFDNRWPLAAAFVVAVSCLEAPELDTLPVAGFLALLAAPVEGDT